MSKIGDMDEEELLSLADDLDDYADYCDAMEDNMMEVAPGSWTVV